MGRFRVVAGAVALGLAAVGAGTSCAVGAAPPRMPTTIARSAHVAYEGCPAKDVELTVTLSAGTYSLGQNVRYWVRLHNLSATTCSQGVQLVPVRPIPGPLSLVLGPCGSLPLSIDNTRGTPVFPNAGGIACPMLLGPSLTPHATLRGFGTWDRVEASSRPARIPTPAPPGRYRLFVGRSVSVPFTLTDTLPTAALTGLVDRSAAPAMGTAAHVAFGGCPSRSVTMRVSIVPNVGAHTVVALVSVHNGSDRWCGPRRRTGSLVLGLCGTVSVVVRDATGHDVFPGNEVVFCPEDTGPGVGPHSSVSGSFRWAGQEDLARPAAAARWQQAPAGHYSFEVGGTLEVPFTLEG